MSSLAVEPIYLYYMSAASSDSTDPEMATTVHKACSDHPNFFCGLMLWDLVDRI